MRILALDQATQTGWAVGDPDSFERKNVESGIFKMPKRPILGERLVIFVNTLNEIIDYYKPDLIAYERPYWPAPGVPRGMVSVNRVIGLLDKPKAAIIGILRNEEKAERGPPKVSAETLQFLQKVEGFVIYTATSRGLPYESYMSSSWRVTALRMGRAPAGSEDGILKKMMVAKAKALGFNPQTEDEADAIGILMHALHGEPGAKRAQGDLLDMAGPEI